MFRRSRSGSTRTRRARTPRPSFLRSRKPLFEQLEDRRSAGRLHGHRTPTTPAPAACARRLIDANNAPNVGGVPDEIHFNIAAAGVHTIQPTLRVRRDHRCGVHQRLQRNPVRRQQFHRFAQHGADDRSSMAERWRGASDGLQINSSAAAGRSIRGLVINRFSGNGIEINGADNIHHRRQFHRHERCR